MATTWDANFELNPENSDDPTNGALETRTLKTAIQERLVKEHNFDQTEGGAQPRHGLHKAGSAVAFYQASAPTTRNGIALGANDAGLVWVDSDTLMLYTWDGAAWAELLIRAYHGVLHGAISEANIFSALSPYIPDVGDIMDISGGAGSYNNVTYHNCYTMIFSHAYRHSSSVIHLRCLQIQDRFNLSTGVFVSHGISATYVTIDSGDTATISISIMY